MIFDDKLRNISPFQHTPIDAGWAGMKDVVRHSREKPCAICRCPTSFVLMDHSLYLCSSECVVFFYDSLKKHGMEITLWEEAGYCPHKDGLERAIENYALTEVAEACYKKGEGQESG